MPEVGRADLVIVPKFDNLGGSVSNALSGVGTKAGGAFSGSFLGGIKASAVAGAVGGLVSSVSGAVGDVARQAFNDAFEGYADREQLLGGIATLYGDAASAIEDRAGQAYATLGVSANDYMEQSVTYAGALLKALDGDAAAAAEYADKAITAQRDNVAKLGTDAQLVENAFVGLTRGNFTMLDNLALGYSGTAEGMAQLVNDSGVLGDEMVATATNVKELGFDVLIDAIVATQDRLGITGTAMEEGTETISGALDRLHASYENLMAGLMDPDADIGQLTDALVDSFGIVFDNVEPAVSRMLGNVLASAPEIAANIVALGGDVVGSLADMLDSDDLAAPVLRAAGDLLAIGRNYSDAAARADGLERATRRFSDAAHMAAGGVKAIGDEAEVAFDSEASIRAAESALSSYNSRTDEVQRTLADAYADRSVGDYYEAQIASLMEASDALDANGEAIGLNEEQQRQLISAVEAYNEATGQQWSVTDAVNAILQDESGNVATTAAEYMNLADQKERAALAGTYRGLESDYLAAQARDQLAVNQAQSDFNRLLDEANPKVRELFEGWMETGELAAGIDLSDIPWVGDAIAEALGYKNWNAFGLFASEEDMQAVNDLYAAYNNLATQQAVLEGDTESLAQVQQMTALMESSLADGADEVTRRISNMSPTLIGATTDVVGFLDSLRAAGVSSDDIAEMSDEQVTQLARDWEASGQSAYVLAQQMYDLGQASTTSLDVTRAGLADISDAWSRANVGDDELESVRGKLGEVAAAYANQEQNAIGLVRAQHEAGAGFADIGDLMIAALNEASASGIVLQGDLANVAEAGVAVRDALGEAGVSFEDLNGIDTEGFLNAIIESGGSVEALTALVAGLAEQTEGAASGAQGVADAVSGIDGASTGVSEVTSMFDAMATSAGAAQQSAADALAAATRTLFGGGGEADGEHKTVIVDVDDTNWREWVSEEYRKLTGVELDDAEYERWVQGEGAKPVTVDADTAEFDAWEDAEAEKPVAVTPNTIDWGDWLGLVDTKGVRPDPETSDWSAWEGTEGTKLVVVNPDTGAYEVWADADGGKSVTVNPDTGEYDVWESSEGFRTIVVNPATMTYTAWENDEGNKIVVIDPETGDYQEWEGSDGSRAVVIDPRTHDYDVWEAEDGTKTVEVSPQLGGFAEWLEAGATKAVDVDARTGAYDEWVVTNGEKTVDILVDRSAYDVDIGSLTAEMVGVPVLVSADTQTYDAQMRVITENGETVDVTAQLHATGDADNPWVLETLQGDGYEGTVTIGADVSGAQGDVDTLTGSVAELVDGEHVVTIEMQQVWSTSETDPAQMMNASNQVEISVDMDTTPAEQKAEEMSTTISMMEAQEAVMLFDLDGSGALDTAEEIEQACDNLAMTEPEIKAIMDGTAAFDTLEKLQSNVYALSILNPTITITASADDAYSTVAALRAYLDSQSWYQVLHVTTVTDGAASTHAEGGTIVEHASGGYIVDGPTVVSRAGGVVHVAGEDGAEAVFHAEGGTTVVPLTNDRYVGPFAEAVARNIDTGGDVYNITINASGQADATALAEQFAREVRRRKRTGVKA